MVLLLEMNRMQSCTPNNNNDAGTLCTGILSWRADTRCRVFFGDEELSCVLRGRLGNEGKVPLVGDYVRFKRIGADEGSIEDILPRKCVLSRQVGHGNRAKRQVYCTNVDTVVITCAAQAPPIRPALIDRLLVTACFEGLTPLICLNKIDIDPEGEAVKVMGLYRELGYEVYITSALNGEGIDALSRRLASCVSVFSGHSGVGKTSILKRLVPNLKRKTVSVTKRSRGRHGTTDVRLLRHRPGGYIIDTPGFREFTVWGVQPDELGSYYPEFLPFASDCRFNNCLHVDEPDCAVVQAVEAGSISTLRYKNYLRLLETHTTG